MSSPHWKLSCNPRSKATRRKRRRRRSETKRNTKQKELLTVTTLRPRHPLQCNIILSRFMPRLPLLLPLPLLPPPSTNLSMSKCYTRGHTYGRQRSATYPCNSNSIGKPILPLSTITHVNSCLLPPLGFTLSPVCHLIHPCLPLHNLMSPVSLDSNRHYLQGA